MGFARSCFRNYAGSASAPSAGIEPACGRHFTHAAAAAGFDGGWDFACAAAAAGFDGGRDFACAAAAAGFDGGRDFTRAAAAAGFDGGRDFTRAAAAAGPEFNLGVDGPAGVSSGPRLLRRRPGAMKCLWTAYDA